MKILITGGTGLIGSTLEPVLRSAGHDINILTRNQESTRCCDYTWNPETEEISGDAFKDVEAVIHLAGENIAGRWTPSKKRRIHESRTKGTRLLRNTISELDNKPRVFVSASAIGYYDDRGDELLTEESEPGDSFLSQVCREWEAASVIPSQKGVRVVNMRFGVILTPEGGALQKMLLPFKMGVGGVVGSGEQYWSWIALDDVVGAIHHAVQTESLKGAVNVVAPNPVTNREFTKTLGKVVNRPTLFPLPKFVAQIALGEMADELLLASARVDCSKLQNSGYEFKYPDLEKALRHELKK